MTENLRCGITRGALRQRILVDVGALVHVNTLLLQAVLEVPEFNELVGEDERRALTPLFWSNINPYGRFRLDMNTRLDLAGGVPAESVL